SELEQRPPMSDELARLRRDNAFLTHQVANYAKENDTLSQAIYTTVDGIWDWNIETNELYLSPQWFSSLGYENNEIPSTIEQWEKLVHPDDLERTWEQLNDYIEGRTSTYECINRLRMKDGVYRWNHDRGHAVERDANGRATRMIGTDQDVTLQKQIEDLNTELERKLNQSEKLKALGVFAGGIAHDFNNILTISFGLIDTLKGLIHQPHSQHTISEKLDTLEGTLDRSKKLVDEILLFSREKKVNAPAINIVPHIRQIIQLLTPSIADNISVDVLSSEQELNVAVDQTHLHQIISNIFINASHALKHDNGTINIRINRAIIEQGFFLQLNPGAYVCISIEDNGHGMSDSVIDRMFDPFFSTKEPGEGQGMGLTIVHGLVNSYNGDISINSTINKGSSFHVYLPLFMDAFEHTHSSTIRELTHVNDNYNVLFVDDETMIVDIIRSTLPLHGIQIDGFNNPEHALDAFKKNPAQYDLLVTDKSMPSMSGIELTQACKAINPNLPVIVFTGFDDETLDLNALGIDELLHKPLKINDLATNIQQLMNDIRGDG
ncbi:MAG: PAS domain-containing protein, partial [Pseudomonadota bacterium]